MNSAKCFDDDLVLPKSYEPMCWIRKTRDRRREIEREMQYTWNLSKISHPDSAWNISYGEREGVTGDTVSESILR